MMFINPVLFRYIYSFLGVGTTAILGNQANSINPWQHLRLCGSYNSLFQRTRLIIVLIIINVLVPLYCISLYTFYIPFYLLPLLSLFLFNNL